MNLRRRHREGAEVSTESLNDIMFFLLLFFLIISTLVNPSVIKLNLPNSAKNSVVDANVIQLQAKKDEKTQIIQYYIENVPIPFENLEQALAMAISRKTNEGGPPSISLHFDKDLTIQDLVDVMQLGARMKVKMALATKTSPNP
jgi:biopolymer transport protein ExbD